MKKFLFTPQRGTIHYSSQELMSRVMQMPVIERRVKQKVEQMRTIIYRECEVSMPKLRVLV